MLLNTSRFLILSHHRHAMLETLRNKPLTLAMLLQTSIPKYVALQAPQPARRHSDRPARYRHASPRPSYRALPRKPTDATARTTRREGRGRGGRGGRPRSSRGSRCHSQCARRPASRTVSEIHGHAPRRMCIRHGLQRVSLSDRFQKWQYSN